MAGGINFRDLMKAMGMYPGNPVDLLWFGDDFSGVVERVGKNVKDLAPGDRVTGLAPYSFRTFVTVHRRKVFSLPKRMSFSDAATLPTVFLTAHYALNELARMQKGESILIHAGIGGVGMAAIQVAQRLGLEIFATAGSVEKRTMLRNIGVPHVLNSRTLEFADHIMEITDGRGVDAVLNSLAREFIPKSLSILALFGRFMEIGKIDVYGNTRVRLNALKDNISCFVIDLAQHLSAKLFSGCIGIVSTFSRPSRADGELGCDRRIGISRTKPQGKSISPNLASGRCSFLMPCVLCLNSCSDRHLKFVGQGISPATVSQAHRTRMICCIRWSSLAFDWELHHCVMSNSMSRRSITWQRPLSNCRCSQNQPTESFT